MAEKIHSSECKPTTTTKPKNDERKKIMKSILKKITEKLASDTACNESNRDTTELNTMEHITMLNIDRDIFGWSLVKTDFEYFSTFLPLLQQSNAFLRTVERKPLVCTKCHQQFKCFLWSLFSGFMDKSTDKFSGTSSLYSSNDCSHFLRRQNQDNVRAVEYYKSILNACEQKNYQYGSFLERFKILAKITKLCPVRYDLLNCLHHALSRDTKERSSKDILPRRLFATILIDRHGTKYCRFRVRTVNKDYDTSRLTRIYGEESFLRVNFAHTSKDLDTSCRLAFAWESLDNRYVDWNVKSFVHNVSVLFHVMRDLRHGTHDVLGRARKVEEELTGNVQRLNRALTSDLAEWSALDFDSLEEQAVLQQRFLSLTDDFYSSTATSIDVTSLQIAGRCFRYLMTTSSGVHKNVHIYSVHKYKNVLKKMFSNASVQEHTGYELKLSLRMGLWFTPSISMNLQRVKVKIKRDLGSHTDGCGRLSKSLAKEMSARWKAGRKHKNVLFSAQNIGPTLWNSGTFQDSEIEYDDHITQPEYYSAFQVRLDGMKGMLVCDSSFSSKKYIKPSYSQLKFKSPEIQNKWDYKTIEMIQCSQPMLSARLNIALISLIVACSKNPATMRNYIMRLAMPEMERLLDEQNRTFAIDFAVRHNDVKSFNMLSVGCSLLETFLAGYYQNYMRRFKIVVGKSRRLFGVADFWHVLKKGEVFVSVSNLGTDTSMGPGNLEQKVLVTKEPCFHRGDLRTFKAVTKEYIQQISRYGKHLAELQDVIVFSCVGEKSEPEKICGSDLDGDQYFVCWDENIVGNLKDPLYEAGDFTAVKKKDLENWYAQRVRQLAENTIRRRETDGRSRSMQTTSSSSRLDSDHEKWLNYHHQPSNEIEDDVEYEIDTINTCNDTHKQTKRDTTDMSDVSKLDIAQASTKAARMATDIADDSSYFSVQDIFDIHMRIVDNLKTEWVTDESWSSMEEFCQIISRVLDAAKTGVMTLKKPVLKNSPLFPFPKYPHFDPSRRRKDCKHSDSPLGDIYNALQTQLKNYLLRNSSSSGDTAGRSETHADNLLYDEIAELKLSFLFYYIKSQCHRSVTTGTASSDDFNNPLHHMIYTHSNPFDAPLDSVIPHVHLQDIKKWYETEIEPTVESNLVKKEAACTTLWKLMTFLRLEAKMRAPLELQVIHLEEEETLSSVNLEAVTYYNGNNSPVLCITQRLLEDLQQVSSETFPIPGTCNRSTLTLSHDTGTKLIERLGLLVEKTFWNDLKLPYPDSIRRTRILKKESELYPIACDKLRDLFDIFDHGCLQKQAVTGEPIDLSSMNSEEEASNDRSYLLRLNFEKIDIDKSYNSPTLLLSKMRDILDCILCFPEAWNKSSSQNISRMLHDKIADTLSHHLQIYKYQNSLRETQKILGDRYQFKKFPRCSWDPGRIDLTELQRAHDHMEELFEFLFGSD